MTDPRPLPDRLPDDVVEYATPGLTPLVGADEGLFTDLSALLALSTPPPAALKLAERLKRVQDLIRWIRTIHRQLEEAAAAAADEGGSLMWIRAELMTGDGFVIRTAHLAGPAHAIAHVRSVDAVCDMHIIEHPPHDLFEPAAVARHIVHNSPADVIVRVIAERGTLNLIERLLAGPMVTVGTAAAHMLAEQVVIRMAAGYAPHSEQLGLTPPEGPVQERAGVRLAAGVVQVWAALPSPGRWVCGAAEFDNPSGVCGGDLPCPSHSREDPPE